MKETNKKVNQEHYNGFRPERILRRPGGRLSLGEQGVADQPSVAA